MSFIKKNILLLTFVQASNYLFPLLTLPYLMRVLEGDNFGLLIMAQAWIQYSIILTDYGFNLSATRLIAISRGNKTEVNKVYTQTMLAKVILVLVSYFVIFIYGFFCGFNGFFILILISSLSLIGSLLFPIWLFQGLEKMKGIVIASSIAKVIAIFMIFILVKNKNDLYYAAFSQSVGFFLAGVVSCIYVYKLNLASITHVSFSSIKDTLRDGFDLFISNVFVSLYTILNVLIIGYYLNATAAGFFSAADKLRVAAQGFLSPVQQAVFPQVALLVNGGISLNDLLKRYGYKFMLLGLGLSIGIALIVYPLTPIYFGDGYESASLILLMMAPIPFFVSVGVVFGQWWLIPCNKASFIRKTYVFVGVLHVILCLIFIRFIDVFGVVLTLVLTEFLASSFFVFRSIFKKNKPYS